MSQKKTKKKNNFRETILVTGGAGFIGSNYLNFLVPKNPDKLFVNVDCLTYAGSISNITVSNFSNYVFTKIDIRKKSDLEKVFNKYNPTGVINFAAESHVDLSIKNPQVFLETNILGTNNLLSLAVKYKVRRFLQVSTDEVYGSLDFGEKSFSETDKLNPRNPYSASKAGAEYLAFSYLNTFGLNVVVTRSSNNFGPNQDKTKLVPLFIDNLLKNKKVPLYGRGKQIRDWIFVDDNVRGINMVFDKGESGQVYNIGGGKELTNLELTKILLKVFNKKEDSISFVSDRPGHDFRYSLNCKKIKNLGWSPKISFEEGLKKTVDYFKKVDFQK